MIYKIQAVTIPMGLIKETNNPNLTTENVELRAALEKAADDADLYVTERMALNKKFYPNGGGFELFSKNDDEPYTFMYYRNKKHSDKVDSFTKEIDSLKIPDNVDRIRYGVRNSSKGNYKGNLDSALKKLNKVLKGNI